MLKATGPLRSMQCPVSRLLLGRGCVRSSHLPAIIFCFASVFFLLTAFLLLLLLLLSLLLLLLLLILSLSLSVHACILQAPMALAVSAPCPWLLPYPC